MTVLQLSDAIIPGMAGYTQGGNIARALHDGRLTRAWGTGARVTSGQLSKKEGKGIWKSWDRMPSLSPQLLDTLESLGVDHPGSYSDCYHQLASKIPPLRHSYNAMFSWWSGGPWEEALHVGIHRGVWHRYDIISAYRWAATLGLPDTRTLHSCIHQRPDAVDGLWIARITPRADLPNTLRNAYNNIVVLSSEEIRTYGIHAEIIRGVTWEAATPADYVERTLTRLPCAKESGRAYWGRWVCRDPLRNFTQSKNWDLPNRLANFIWGWLIVGRVRMRVWLAAQDAAHVYVDEVVTPYKLQTGTAIGDWKLKEQFDNGIRVRRTGRYHALGDTLSEPERVIMKTGEAA